MQTFFFDCVVGTRIVSWKRHEINPERLFETNLLRDVVSVEVDDGADEVVLHGDGPDGLPVGGVLAQQQADGLQCHLHHGRRIGHRADLYVNRIVECMYLT